MYKYIVQFEKCGAARYVSHLDVVRVFGRALRRAGLPVSHSQGFNPHPLLTFGHPLSLGVASLCELAEISLDGEIAPEELKERLNAAMPAGFAITAAKRIEGKNGFGALAQADYRITLSLDGDVPQELVERYFAQENILCERRTKSKTEMTDIKPFILSLKAVSGTGGEVTLEARLKTGNENLKPSLLASSLAAFAGRGLEGAEILRLSLLDGEGRPLFEQ